MDSVAVEAAGREAILTTDPDKVFFPERGETKLDLVRFYTAIADPIMAAMGDRPVLLNASRTVQAGSLLPEASAGVAARLDSDGSGQHPQRDDIGCPGGG